MGDVPGPSSAPYFNQRKATENFSRLCQLIMTICSDLFRDILSRYIKPADLRSELDNNRNRLERIMNAQQKEQIYTASGSVTLTAKDLDISVLYIILRNICNIPKHRAGWGNPPLNGDKRLSACIERIRIQRNLISAHSVTAAVDDLMFQEYWDVLKDAIIEIEKQSVGGDMYERGVNELLSCDLNPGRSKLYVEEFKKIQENMQIKQERIERLESKTRTAKHQLAVKKMKITRVEQTNTLLHQRMHDNKRYIDDQLPLKLQEHEQILLSAIQGIITEESKKLQDELKKNKQDIQEELKKHKQEIQDEFKQHKQEVKGPQAASHQTKIPSPTVAGFDESTTGQIRLDAWSSSGTGNHVKTEDKQLSSCQFSSATSDTSPLPERHRTSPPRRASPHPPPPLIHTGNLQSNNTQSPSQGKQMPESKDDDPNEDYCAVCQIGGYLLCCDKCRKVYHLKCHIPELKECPSDEWQCTLCTKADDMVLSKIEKKDFTMGPGKRKAPSGLTEKELKACERILLELYTNKDSAVFHEPVHKLVPNYYKIITRPIDFSKIRSKLQRQNLNHYNTVEEFLSDCKLVFKNCATYNSVGTPIYDQGKMLDEEFERLVQKFLPCYFDILDDLDTRTDTPVSDASDRGPREKK
ncbi:nucleosome-remodeling factor subunit BPTF-like isoform X2 [Saccostrea cucullata]|uniref:nucleosome-remodeling factor subunit BPTF-like isoform X2 n=1 Tax=Saccostrea cuccullata TaxID=36930 RepID=UPI002ED63943